MLNTKGFSVSLGAVKILASVIKQNTSSVKAPGRAVLFEGEIILLIKQKASCVSEKKIL